MAQETSTAQDDWIGAAVQTFVDAVEKVRSTGTENAIKSIRGVVYGVVAAVFGIIAVVFAVIILVRLADAYLPIGAGVGDATWAAHLFIGGLLCIIGFGLWASRKTDDMRRVGLAVTVDVLIVVAIVVYGLIDLFA